MAVRNNIVAKKQKRTRSPFLLKKTTKLVFSLANMSQKNMKVLTHSVSVTDDVSPAKLN